VTEFLVMVGWLCRCWGRSRDFDAIPCFAGTWTHPTKDRCRRRL